MIASLRPLLLELLLAGGAALLLVIELLLPGRHKRWIGLGAAALSAAVLAASFFLEVGGVALNGAYVGTEWALFFKRLFLAAAVMGTLASVDLLEEQAPRRQGEYPLLLLLSVVGMMMLPGARDLIFLLVSFELMGVPLYLLAAYGKDEAAERAAGSSLAAEAALKLYLVGAASTAVIIFGAACVAGMAGGTSLSTVLATEASPLFVVGGMLMIGGMAFKLGAAPFHMWVPDTYQGAPTPFVAFLSVAPKAAGIAALASLLWTGLANTQSRWLPVIAALAVGSVAVGNVLAVPQTSVKRLLAFSGVAQMGYVLLGFATGTREGMVMVLFYLAAYLATNAGAFLAVHAVTQNAGSDELVNFDGLGRRAPALAAGLLILLLSLAGIPFVVGFWAKLYVFTAAMRAGMTWLVVVAALLAIVALFYYLKIVKAMYMAEPRSQKPLTIPLGVTLGIAASVAVAIGAGLYPAPLVLAAERAVAALGGG